MSDPPLAGRSALKVFRDILSGIGIGVAIALVFSTWALSIKSSMQGGVGGTYELQVLDLEVIAVHVGGLGLAGAIGAALRPWLGTLGGQAVVCWVTSFGLYGGVRLVMPPLFDNVLIGGMVVATLATPMWLGVLRLRGSGKSRGVR